MKRGLLIIDRGSRQREASEELEIICEGIRDKGEYSFVFIGTNYSEGEIPQFTVPAHYFFAAEVIEKDSFSFVGCTVSPGFDFRDFTLPSCKELSKEFPDHKSKIEGLTHN